MVELQADCVDKNPCNLSKKRKKLICKKLEYNIHGITKFTQDSFSNTHDGRIEYFKS